MTQSFIQPKGTLKPQIDVSNLMQNWANNIAQEQVQGKEAKPDPIRETVNELVKSNLLNKIEIPKPYTTIQDVFNANNGDRFKALGEWFNSPQFNRMTGGDFTYNPVTKRMESSGERIGREQEARLNADREKALEQQKQQLALANNVYDAYNRMDIANEENQLRRDLAKEELAWRKEENALDRQLKRESLNAQIQHQRTMEGIARLNAQNKGGGARLGTSAAENLSGTYQGIKQMTTLKGKIDQLPSRITTPGIAQISSKNPFDTEAQTFNQYVKTYKQVIGKGLEGGVLRKEDEYKYDQIIPKLGDTKAVLRKKADQLQNMLEEKYSNDMDFYNMAGYNTGNFPTMGGSNRLGLDL